ncbi:MAG: hypothetical protein AB2693_17210, partial [Candidatus Thiodiazotropha sp.]
GDPMVNEIKHIAFQTLNQKFRPPFADPEKGTVTIMWTNTSVPEQSHNFVKSKTRREWVPIISSLWLM